MAERMPWIRRMVAPILALASGGFFKPTNKRNSMPVTRNAPQVTRRVVTKKHRATKARRKYRKWLQANQRRVRARLKA